MNSLLLPVYLSIFVVVFATSLFRAFGAGYFVIKFIFFLV